MPQDGTVLLVEPDADARERFGSALESAGYELILCPGPTAPDYACIGGREGHCPLVERADVIVLDPWLEGDGLEGTSAQDLVELYTTRGRTVVLLGPTSLLEPYSHGRVIALGDHPRANELVAAVRSAPGAQGFVLRAEL